MKWHTRLSVFAAVLYLHAGFHPGANSEQGTHFGHSVASAGEINHDGGMRIVLPAVCTFAGYGW